MTRGNTGTGEDGQCGEKDSAEHQQSVNERSLLILQARPPTGEKRRIFGVYDPMGIREGMGVAKVSNTLGTDSSNIYVNCDCNSQTQQDSQRVTVIDD